MTIPYQHSELSIVKCPLSASELHKTITVTLEGTLNYYYSLVT